MNRSRLLPAPLMPMGWWLILTGFCLTRGPAAEPGPTVREVFPVPSAIAGVFQSGGLAAFDPFSLWERGRTEPLASLATASPGADAGLLPVGRLYDVLPVWQARGFRPQAGTRVLYHPASRLLFARMSAGDAEEVRVFCQWPAGVWLADNGVPGSYVQQLQVRVSVWAVPATGPGGWPFRPERPEDLMALPPEARRLKGRQTFTVRGGQKSKAETINKPRRTPDLTGPGMVTEVECSFADDREIADFLFAVSTLTDRGQGTLSESLVLFHQVAKVGEEWLVEGGCLPGNPPERLFHVFDSFPVGQDAAEPVDLEKVVSQWTGKQQPAPASADGMSGWILDRYEIQYLAGRRYDAALPKPAKPDSDPFAPGQRADPLPGLDGQTGPVVAVPALFGEAKVSDITPVLAEFFGLAPGDIQAWVQPPGLFASRFVFVRGKPAALESMNRQMDWSDPEAFSYSPVILTADVTLTRALPETPPEQEEVVWRGRVPVRGGQSSLLKNQVWPDAGEDAKPGGGAWDLKIEALRTDAAPTANPTDPAKPDSWNLAISGSLRPPLVDAASGLAYQTNDGTPEGATLRKTVGKTGDGQEVILTVRLTPDPPIKASGAAVAPRRVGSGNMAWWWQQQVANAGAK